MTLVEPAPEKGLRQFVDRRLRARVWAFLRTAPVLARVTARVEGRLRRHRAVEGIGVPAGRRAPEAAAEAPVVLLLALGASSEELGSWAATVEAAQDAGPPFRPLWLVDSPAFGVLLDRGWAFDHVMPRAGYERSGATTPWDRYLGERLDIWRVRTADAPVLVLLGPPLAGTPGVERLSGAVTALTADAPEERPRFIAPVPAAASSRRRTRS